MTADQLQETNMIDITIEQRGTLPPEEVARIDAHNDLEHQKFITAYRSLFPARDPNTVRRS